MLTVTATRRSAIAAAYALETGYSEVAGTFRGMPGGVDKSYPLSYMEDSSVLEIVTGDPESGRPAFSVCQVPEAPTEATGESFIFYNPEITENWVEQVGKQFESSYTPVALWEADEEAKARVQALKEYVSSELHRLRLPGLLVVGTSQSEDAARVSGVNVEPDMVQRSHSVCQRGIRAASGGFREAEQLEHILGELASVRGGINSALDDPEDEPNGSATH